MCTVNATSGALTLAGVGDCVVTATAEGTANYSQATADFTVTVQPAGNLVLNLDAVAGDDTVNIAEKTAGFATSGDTGSEAGVTVSVTIGSQSPLTATSAANGAWSVSVPADATYITGTSVTVTVSATKTGFTAPSSVTRTLTVDLNAPSASYTRPGHPAGGRGHRRHDAEHHRHRHRFGHRATGLPPGLSHREHGSGVISGTPDTANDNPCDRHGDGDRHRRQPRHRVDRLPRGDQG